MRSEPVTPVQSRRGEARRNSEAAPTPATADAFEASLQRARRGRGGPGDEGEWPDDPMPPANPQPLQASLPQPPAPPVEALAPRWAPQPLQAADAVTRQLQAQALPDDAGEPGHWQLQITQAGLPVQRLDLQRSAAGPLTVLLSASADAQQSPHSTRLRQRLARSGARLAFRGPSTEPE